MESFATPYPVYFYDGEEEHDRGHVGIHSVLTFKRFQALMAQKTGISATQLSAVFVCRRTLRDTEKRQKLPVNENTNFNIILNQHNPSRERDCHFLVSMKKSKKERKGTRKRSTEAENADDDDSTSSRGDCSPSDERPKASISDETFFPEVTSPLNILQGSSSPSVVPSSNLIQRPSSPCIVLSSDCHGLRIGSSSPNGKWPLGVTEHKAGQTLLCREGPGQNGFTSPRLGWGSGMMNQSVEGFTVPSGMLGKVENHVLDIPNGSSSQQEDRGRMDDHWTQSSRVDDVNGTETETETVSNHMVGQSHLLHSSGRDLFHLDRFNDVASQGIGMTPSSTIILRGNGVPIGSSPGLRRNSLTLSASSTSRAAISSISSTIVGTFIPRVSKESLSAVASTRGGLRPQQARSHISHLQHQHQSPLTGIINHLELSKLNGMLLGLVTKENRGEATKICKFCSFLRERNIGPPPFHWCVDDTITKGFRGPSPAGPIGRPVKQHVEATA